MANFKTHLIVGATGSALLAVASMTVTELSPLHYTLFFMLGAFGGILPDIDSDRSWAINLVFTITESR